MKAIGHGRPEPGVRLELPAPVIVLEALSRFVPPDIVSFGLDPNRPSQPADQAFARFGGSVVGHRHRDLDRPGHSRPPATGRRDAAILASGFGDETSPVQVGPLSGTHPVGCLRPAATVRGD